MCLFNVSVDAHQMVVPHQEQDQKIACGHPIVMAVRYYINGFRKLKNFYSFLLKHKHHLYTYTKNNKHKHIMATLTTAATPQKWRVSWNAKFYDYEGRIQAAQKCVQFRIFWQSWGNRSLKSIGNIRANDIVYITCEGHCVAKGVITQPFAERTIEQDEYSKTAEGDKRHENGQFCQILLKEMPSPEMRRKLPGNQMTFSQGTELTNFLAN